MQSFTNSFIAFLNMGYLVYQGFYIVIPPSPENIYFPRRYLCFKQSLQHGIVDEKNRIRKSVVMFTLFTSVLLNTKLVPSLLNVPSPRALDVDTDYTDRT